MDKTRTPPWTPHSWQNHKVAQPLPYDDPQEVAEVYTRLSALPPLVNPWEIDALRKLLVDAEEGRRFVLQGGDCAESLRECNAESITNKIKILLQMSLVLILGGKQPVIRIGRFAGQYAKPRSSPLEVRSLPDGTRQELPSYFGDLINRAEFTREARRADPHLLIAGYQHAAMTLNYIRSLALGGFADLHHPERWDLAFFGRGELPSELVGDYQRIVQRLGESLRFMEALGERSIEKLTRVDFYTCHEGLNLYYESAQTKPLEERPGTYYDLTTHLPWIGERTRDLQGAHVEFFRGVENPIGVKLGPSARPEDVVHLCKVLNPANQKGKLLLTARMGADKVAGALPPLIEAVRGENLRALWVCDPMHGNTKTLRSGVKTRNFEDILREVELSFDIHEQIGSFLSGVHFELTGEDVTECLGGGIREEDLDRNYVSLCDPRLNYRQALEMAFRVARRMGG